MTRRPWPLIVRRARPDDEQAVLGFASRTWNDWDYVPHAWPRWIDAPDGVLLVGTPGATGDGVPPRDSNGEPLAADRPVAVVRVALVAPGEAWLEAIRVDPRVRGMDIATDLQVAELHWAAAQGATIVRYATSARNEASHRLGARGDFELLTSLSAHRWRPTAEKEDGDHEPSGFLPEVQAATTERRERLLARLAEGGYVAVTDEADPLWSRLQSDPGFAAAGRLYEPRPWALEALSEPKFRHHLAAGEVVRPPAGAGWALAILVRRQQPAEDATLHFAMLAGDGPAVLALCETARELAGESIRFRVAAEGGPITGHERAFRDAGYDFPDWALHVLWRPLDDAHPPPASDSAKVQLADRPHRSLMPPA